MVMALSAILSGHSGVMHFAQLQLGMVYLGLFGSTALLLYLHVSSLTPMPPHGTFAVVFVAAWCAIILWYRSSKYVDTSPLWTTNSADSTKLGRVPALLGRFGQILNPSISVFAVLVVVVALMEFYFAGLAAIGRDSIAALQTGTAMPGAGLIALVLLPLCYPIVDVANWQRLAAIERGGASGKVEPGRRSAVLRHIFRIYVTESPLLWLFMCMFGAIAVVATETPAGADIMAAFMAQLVLDQNEVTAVVLPLLLIGVFAIALSTMSSMFSASLCTIRYDVLPETADEAHATRRTFAAGLGFFLAIVVAFFIAEASLQISFSSSAFLALLFAFCCAQLSFLPLVFGPIINRTGGGSGAVSPRWALAVLASGAAGGACAAAAYFATGNEAWLWAAVPACLGSGLSLFTVARLTSEPSANR
jgi:hypothetical protein